MITLYGIPNCDTVKKARAWLADHGLDVQFHDFKKMGVPQPQIDAWLQSAGWETVINRKGTAGMMRVNFSAEALRQTFGDARTKIVIQARKDQLKKAQTRAPN